MTPRDTRTGGVLEEMILPALQQGGYTFRKQVVVGRRPGGSRHKIDILAHKGEGKPILISLKWQQVVGTAEQKVPFEVICLCDEILGKRKQYRDAYLVLGGDGWKLRDYYVSGRLSKHLKHARLVKIHTLESFIRLANQGKL